MTDHAPALMLRHKQRYQRKINRRITLLLIFIIVTLLTGIEIGRAQTEPASISGAYHHPTAEPMGAPCTTHTDMIEGTCNLQIAQPPQYRNRAPYQTHWKGTPL